MRAGLLGRKLGHSLSPQIHHLFADCDYRLFEREPGEVADFVRGLDLDFLNVTIPYKQTAAELCDELTPGATRLGNVNFVRRDAAGRLIGDNTDAFGFARLLDSAGVDVAGCRVAVFGAGGAAMTAKAVIEERGGEVSLVRRGEQPARETEVIVNATPVGMFPNGDETRVNIADYPDCRAVVDLVYNPSPTKLVREALSLGKVAVDGMVMLIAQAYRAQQLVGGDFRGNLYLYGAPASGKSTWAKRISAAIGLKLVDLDAEIVRTEGVEISEIFAKRGEAEFRRLERAALTKVAQDGGQVVALGGGALLDPSSRSLAEATGRVVLLDCPKDELLRRAALSSARPLFAGDLAARLEALLARRQAHYAAFVNRVELMI